MPKNASVMRLQKMEVIENKKGTVESRRIGDAVGFDFRPAPGYAAITAFMSATAFFRLAR
jgi:hypothetical protein